MLEAVTSLVGMVMCWLLCVFIYDDDMSLTRYGLLATMGAVAVYFSVRFVHWAWVTPIPFVGNT